jgi:hypothetical protein
MKIVSTLPQIHKNEAENYFLLYMSKSKFQKD